jgi:Tol biopolymer transport system component
MSERDAMGDVLLGQRLGPYTIGARLGGGGMGEVYRARDAQLGRDVAIKLLPPIFAADPERLTRFRREAQILASLNHPNIGAIYGLEESGCVTALVMELVEGEDLSQRLARGAVPLDQALAIARQIADALEGAHAQGVVHRDLKPANIRVRSDGTVKVLDFGLAKAQVLASADASAQVTEAVVSGPGMVLGTPAYMAPEQARGEPAARAADVWGFGCVLFELLSGTPPFRGTTSTEVLAEILKGEPDWAALPAGTPLAIRRVLRRCLAKDVRSRFHDVADVRIALEDATDTQATAVPATRSRLWERVALGIALLAIAAAVVLFMRQPSIPGERRVDIVTPPEADAGGIALSADGSRIAYTALIDGVPFLYVRSLETGGVRAVPGTGGAALPFWSPDGQFVAFFAESQLKTVNLSSGAIQRLATATLSPAGGSWSRNGTIVFAPSIQGRILRVRQSGADVAEVRPSGRSPRFLADGRRFLFLEYEGVFVGSLDSPDVQLVSEAWRWAIPELTGYIVFRKKGSEQRLFIQRFDEDRLTVTGAETVLAPVNVSTDGNAASASVSPSGVIAFREVSAADAQPRRLSEFDRSGKELRRITETAGLSPTSSPDGRYVAVNRTLGGNSLWLVELARGLPTRFTDGPADQVSVWSADGREIAFASARRDFVEIFIKPLDGAAEKPLLDPPPDTHGRVPTDWAGGVLLIRENNGANFDIYAVPTRGSDQRLKPIVRTEYSERDAQFSPDMHWIAYESNKSGQSEIYMTRYPEPGREFPVSTKGGAQVRWNPANRNELFYVSLDGKLMSTTLEFSADGTTVTPLNPVALFQARIGAVLQAAQKQQYVVSRDGQRFFISTVIEEGLSPITLILNWKPPAE